MTIYRSDPLTEAGLCHAVKELDELLRDKISGALDEVQKTNKIGNLLSALRRKGRIRNFGSTAAPKWRLME